MTQHNEDLFDYEYEEDSNPSNNQQFSEILSKRMDRRTVLKGGAGLTTAAFFGSLPLAGCTTANSTSPYGSGTTMTASGLATPAAVDTTRPQALKFAPVAHTTIGDITVADGYHAEPILPLGTPLVSGIEDWKDNREQSGESFEYRMGDNHDGMWFFGKQGNGYHPKESNSGLLVMNHEYVNAQHLHPSAIGKSKKELHEGKYVVVEDPTAEKIYQKKRLASDVRREVNCHGVAVVEMKKKANGQGYEMVKDSPFNRRVTSATKAVLSGPVAGHALVKTKYDPSGRTTRGINNNCGAGLSPWGTYLTTEENFLGVFGRGEDTSKIGEKANFARKRYGAKENFASWGYLWYTPAAKDEIFTDEFARWDMTAKEGDASQDYRNVFNTFGYITEIDPFNPKSAPVKRTALGRFAHENCAFAPVVEGQPVVFYMGDDSRGEYIYKFVSAAKWSNSDIGGGHRAGDKYMNKGTLYVAKFNENGTGEWKALKYGVNGLDASNKALPFNSQAEVLIFARAAADAVHATRMDRPEWLSVSPMTGEVYCTLTNNAKKSRVWDNNPDGGRTKIDTVAANPRSYGKGGNVHGHIIRWAESGNNHTATTFEWDIYLFAAPNDLSAENLSGLNANNDMSAPDGLFFDPRGVLWIETDDGKYTDTTSCMLLAALPGQVGDGQTTTTSAGTQTRVGAAATDENIKRFFVGPKGCEVTGITMTPDFKTMFINIQHPGGNWSAANNGSTPRSATVMITKKDGGVILGESMA
ncbi:PhoX family phosphatase [Psychrobacter sp. HD31]